MRKLVFIIVAIVIVSSCSTTGGTQSQTDSLEITNDPALLVEEKIKYVAMDEDIAIYIRLIAFADSLSLKNKKFSEIEIELAKQLLGTPYVASTLEQDGEEELVVNLRGLDCTTFLENIVSISYCVKSGNTTFNDYCNILAKFRYRDGKIDTYPSRLHYFTDWLINNEKKGLLKIVSNDFGNADFDPTVGFMSKNTDKYKKLSNNPEFVTQIEMQELAISKAKMKYITKDLLEANADKIMDGDLIAFSTTINGLDVSHVAIAAIKDNRLHFYHASSSKKAVVLSTKPMSEYLAGMKRNDGVLVARIVE